jgi:tRNA nucleotidyltransferase/poly(A) polymerase
MENNFIVNNNDSFFKCRKLDPYLSNHKGYIAGGCFKDIFMNKKFRDIDIFFEKVEDFNEALTFYQKNEDYSFVYENKNAVCFVNKTKLQT